MRQSLKGRVMLSRVLATPTTLPWTSEWPLRHCGSRPAQTVAGRASGRDWSATRWLWRPCALQRSAAVRDGRCDLQWPQCVPTRLRPPSDTVDLLVEQVGHRCGFRFGPIAVTKGPKSGITSIILSRKNGRVQNIGANGFAVFIVLLRTPKLTRRTALHL